MWRIVAEHVDNGNEAALLKSKDLNQLAMRLVADAEKLRRWGWEGFTLEDDTLGIFTETLEEHLRMLMVQKFITFETWKTLKGLCS